MPSAERHDLSELPYSPTVWQRIGGPWSITLRAYLWTAPLGIIAQPVVEQSFWDDYRTLPIWFLISALAYLVFGLVLWVGWYTLIAQHRKVSTSAILVVSIAVAASMCRSATIGFLLDPFGLVGIDWIARLPFAVFLGFAWVATSALIMDSKYRYRLHLRTLVSEQVFLLKQNRQWLSRVGKKLSNSSRVEIEESHRTLQQALREIAILSNNPDMVWSKVTSDIKRAAIRIALVDEKDSWTSEKDVTELQGSRSKAFAVITTTPLMSVPVAMTFTALTALFGASRLYTFWFSAAIVSFGVALHILILESSRFMIRRQTIPSVFGYFVMMSLLLVSSLLSTALVSPDNYDLFGLRTFVVTATIFEIVWLVATGFIQFSQVQRQKIIEGAKVENVKLKRSLEFWQRNFLENTDAKDISESPLLVVAAAMTEAIETQDLELGLQAIEFSNLYFAEFAVDYLLREDFGIETELTRLSTDWIQQAEIIWTFSGGLIEMAMSRRVIAALEVCISKAIRHGNANIISIDVKCSGHKVSIKVSDNGKDYVEASTGLGIEIIQELSNGTWRRNRSGGINVVTAQFS